MAETRCRLNGFVGVCGHFVGRGRREPEVGNRRRFGSDEVDRESPDARSTAARDVGRTRCVRGVPERKAPREAELFVIGKRGGQ